MFPGETAQPPAVRLTVPLQIPEQTAAGRLLLRIISEKGLGKEKNVHGFLLQRMGTKGGNEQSQGVKTL